MNTTTPNNKVKTRRAKLHVRKTYKNIARRQSTFMQIFNGLDEHTNNVEAKYEGYQVTYGEITEAGIHKMAKIFSKYTPLSQVPVQNRTFYDLGCGLGKAVIGMALLHPQIRSIGIEVVEERARQAGVAIGRVGKTVQNRCGIVTGSFVDEGFSYGNACWIFISNTYFSSEINESIVEKLGREIPVGCVIQSAQELPNALQNRMVLKEIHRIPMTWTNESQMHVYVKE
jgi:precorrin-6B methylase 2